MYLNIAVSIMKEAYNYPLLQNNKRQYLFTFSRESFRKISNQRITENLENNIHDVLFRHGWHFEKSALCNDKYFIFIDDIMCRSNQITNIQQRYTIDDPYLFIKIFEYISNYINNYQPRCDKLRTLFSISKDKLLTLSGRKGTSKQFENGLSKLFGDKGWHFGKSCNKDIFYICEDISLDNYAVELKF